MIDCRDLAKTERVPLDDSLVAVMVVGARAACVGTCVHVDVWLWVRIRRVCVRVCMCGWGASLEHAVQTHTTATR